MMGGELLGAGLLCNNKPWGVVRLWVGVCACAETVGKLFIQCCMRVA